MKTQRPDDAALPRDAKRARKTMPRVYPKRIAPVSPRDVFVWDFGGGACMFKVHRHDLGMGLLGACFEYRAKFHAETVVMYGKTLTPERRVLHIGSGPHTYGGVTHTPDVGIEGPFAELRDALAAVYQEMHAMAPRAGLAQLPDVTAAGMDHGVVNEYTGKGMGYHNDGKTGFHPRVVLSVSAGGARDFKVAHKDADGLQEVASTRLEAGDVVIMVGMNAPGGPWRHAVGDADGDADMRWNLTFRAQ